MVSLFPFLADFQTEKVDPEAAPRLAVGAASPLWLMFGGAAAAGATYWWWASRWREAVNLEAVMALAPEPVAPLIEAEAAPEAPEELVAEPIETVAAEEPVLEKAALDEPLLEAAPPPAEVTPPAIEPPVELLAESLSPPTLEPAPAADPVEVAVEAPPVGAPAIADSADDLTRLVGVGPKLAASLAELGVTRFSQIAAWTPEELSSIDQLLNLRGRAERDAWIAQAKRFATALEG